MWLTSGMASGRKKTLLQYSLLPPLERECYEGGVQPYRKTDYKAMMTISILSIGPEYLTHEIRTHSTGSC